MRVHGTDFLLGGNAEERDDSFFCIPVARCGGDGSRSRDEFNIVIGIVERRHIVKQGVPLERVRIVCRFVKHIGQRTPLERASGGAS